MRELLLIIEMGANMKLWKLQTSRWVLNEQSNKSNNKRGDFCQLGIKKKIEDPN